MSQPFFVADGGFAQMVDNRLTLLTEQAAGGEEIDRESAQAALSEARAMSTEGDSAELYDARQTAIERAQAQLKLVEPESPY